MAWFEGWDQPPDQKVIEEETCAEQQRGNEMKKREKKARGFKGQWSRQNHEGGVQVWRDEETHIARTVVYQAGGERETDEPPPLLCYSGGHVFKRLLIWLFGPPPLTLAAFGHG